MKIKSKLLLLMSSVLSLSICNADENIITFKGLEYKELSSTKTGKSWLDRNLGAQKACVDSSDKKCYGDYYQWGREADGHEKRNSSIRKNIAKDYSEAGNSFIAVAGKDWIIENKENVIEREKNWSKIDGSSICPKGYRVPTIKELENDIRFLHSTFPESGYRNVDGGFDDAVAIWSTTPTSKSISNIVLLLNGVQTMGLFRAHGASVRCIKN